MEPKPTYTLDADVEFYVKPTSNCEGLALTTLHQLFGGTWSTLRYRADSIMLKTGNDLTPRQVVGWTDLYGGTSCPVNVYERIGDEDDPAVALVGGNSGVRILANEDEDFEPAPGAEHLPPGWGAPVLLVEEFADIVDPGLRAALQLDTNVPDYEPPDWAAEDEWTVDDYPGMLPDLKGRPPEVIDAISAAVQAKTSEWLDNSQPSELDFDDLAEVARAWPWAIRDALARYVARAMTQAGIDDLRQRLAVQREIMALFGE